MPTYTVQLVLPLDRLRYCPMCGEALVHAAAQIASGPECPIAVCAQCATAWPVQEDD